MTITRTPSEGERKNFLPFLIQKESGQLDPDLLVTFNTSELLADTAFQASEKRGEAQALVPPRRPVGTADLIDSIVSDIESSFNGIDKHSGPAAQETPEALLAPYEAAQATEASHFPEPPRSQ